MATGAAGCPRSHASFKDVLRHVFRRAAPEPYPKCDRNSNAGSNLLELLLRYARVDGRRLNSHDANAPRRGARAHRIQSLDIPARNVDGSKVMVMCVGGKACLAALA